MTRQILTFLFCSWTIVSFAQISKQPCHDIDFLIKGTINALNSKDDKEYLKLVDYDAMMLMLQENSTKDTTVVKLYEQMKSRKVLFTMVFQSSFLELAERIEKELKTSKWKIKLNEYYTESKEEDPTNIHYTLILKVKAAGKKYHLMMYASKFHDCYYIFEPITSYFTSGW